MGLPITLWIALITYVVAGAPAASVVKHLWSVDLRSEGTGNPGAGNATRTAGLAAGATLALLDGFKGLVPILISRSIGLGARDLVVVGLGAVIGNNWPVWRTERGGRGLATSSGVLVGFAPALAIWPGIWSVIGWHIGGGTAGFLGWGVLPLFVLATGGDGPTVVLAVGLALIMMIRRAQGNGGFRPAGVAARVLHDQDPRASTTPTRPLALSRPGGWTIVFLAVGLPAYLLMTRSLAGDQLVGWMALALLLGACITEFAAKWVFGELFREGVVRSGRTLSRSAAFRAALVGTGVARLVPVGGAITPVAMSWAVGKETPNTTGAAVRATTLNYAGLALATGAGLLWVTGRFPDPTAPKTSIAVGLLAAGSGIVLIGFATRLRKLASMAPARFRERLKNLAIDHHMTRGSWSMLTGRVLLEAATLGLTLAAFGVSLSPSQTVTAFGVSQLIGGLPGTPGGLGITEVGLIGALGFFGIPAAVGAAPVVVFRVVSYWLPAVGGVLAGGNSFIRNRRAFVGS